jgi:small-conductance mechanosensitive channel
MAGVSATLVQAPDLDSWFAALIRPTSLKELGVLFACGAVAWVLVWLARRATTPAHTSVLFGRRVVDGVLFPLLWLSLAYVARVALAPWLPMTLFRIAIPALVALASIRLGVKVLQVAFHQARWMRWVERTISWVAWIAVVMWISGLLPLVMEELEQIHWRVGSTRLSVRNIIEGGLTAGAVLILTLWVSSAIESRLLRSATGSELSLRKAISNALSALLMFVGLLLALTSVGIDLTALSVLGGAVGVGIGLGLQRLAANYVSGFVILAERSMRIGDNVRVDNFEGRITDINARYTVIRAMTGRESIVPNEMMVNNRVENLSLADTTLWQSTVVSVAYDSDVALVSRLLVEAALAQSRVLKDPGPSAALSAFGADGLEFTLGYWIADPENGQLNVRSAINIAILESLRRNGVGIPYPQRVIHHVSPPAA